MTDPGIGMCAWGQKGPEGSDEGASGVADLAAKLSDYLILVCLVTHEVRWQESNRSPRQVEAGGGRRRMVAIGDR